MVEADKNIKDFGLDIGEAKVDQGGKYVWEGVDSKYKNHHALLSTLSNHGNIDNYYQKRN